MSMSKLVGGSQAHIPLKNLFDFIANVVKEFYSWTKETKFKLGRELELSPNLVHDRMVQLVERMIDLHKKKQHANADSEKELFEHQIKATDNEIDELVYKLYRLSEEEKKIVEENTTKS